MPQVIDDDEEEKDDLSPDEARRREEKRRQRREEKRRRKEEKARQRELASRPDDESSDECEKKRRVRDGQISTKLMDGAQRKFWGESVKGRVSNDYRGFSDADLERRFGEMQNAGGKEKLMTEEEALAMLRKGRAQETVKASAPAHFVASFSEGI